MKSRAASSTVSLLVPFAVAAALTAASATAAAATYPIGASRPNKTLASVMEKLQPGDVVEFDGGEDYATDVIVKHVEGAKGNPITLRGVTKDGKQPVLRGGHIGITLYLDHVVLENFEVTGQDTVGVSPAGDDITLRQLYVHDCACQGVLAPDDNAGDITIEYSHFTKTGAGQERHQIYVTSDRGAHPGAVFRMHHNYVHDSAGGLNVKVRSERSEIYYNWIEAAVFNELDLIGNENGSKTPANHDVVGNVLVKKADAEWFIARVGGDGDGESRGRVRFVNNTMILGARKDAIAVQAGLESLELSNNVITRPGGGVAIVTEEDPAWLSGRKVGGSNNWAIQGSSGAPELTGTILGADPMFVDAAGRDLRPKEGSPLIDKGSDSPLGPVGAALPDALKLPAFQPDPALVSTATARPVVGAIDVGAYEFGSGPPRQAESTGASTPPAAANGDGGSSGGCSCSAGPHNDTPAAALIALAVGALYMLVRRDRR